MLSLSSAPPPPNFACLIGPIITGDLRCKTCSNIINQQKSAMKSLPAHDVTARSVLEHANPVWVPFISSTTSMDSTERPTDKQKEWAMKHYYRRDENEVTLNVWIYTKSEWVILASMCLLWTGFHSGMCIVPCCPWTFDWLGRFSCHNWLSL